MLTLKPTKGSLKMTQGISQTRNTGSLNLSSAIGTLQPTKGGTGLTAIGNPHEVLAVNASGTGFEFTSQSSALQLYSENPVSPSPPTATGVNSIALLSESHAEAQDSLAIGVQSLSRVQGSIVHSSGRFANSGDAQIGRYTLRATTVNAVPSRLFIDGVNVPLTMPDNSTWSFRIVVTGHRTDINDGHAGVELKGVMYRLSGAVTTMLQGLVAKTVLSKSNSSWDVTVTADTTNGGIAITATGESSKTIRWLALVETVEITN